MTLKEGFLFHLFSEQDDLTIVALRQGYYSKDSSFSEIGKELPSIYFLFKRLTDHILVGEFEGRKFRASVDGDDWLGIQVTPISEDVDQLIEFVFYVEVEYDETDDDGDPKIDQGQIQITFDKDLYYQINWSTGSERGKIELDSRGNL